MRENGGHKEPEGSAARAELRTLAWGTETASRDSRSLMQKPFLFKNVDMFNPLGSSKNKLASQGQSSIRKASGLVVTSVFGRVLPQFGGYQICCLLFTFPGLPAV